MAKQKLIVWEGMEDGYTYIVTNKETEEKQTVNIKRIFGEQDYNSLSLFQRSCIRNGIMQKLRDSYALSKDSSVSDKWRVFTETVTLLENGQWNKANASKGMSKTDRFREAITPLREVLDKEAVRKAFEMHPGFSDTVLDEVFGNE